MNAKFQCWFIALTLLSGLQPAAAQGTAFAYQGQLNNGGSPANGLYDLRFRVWNASTNGNLVAGPLTNSATGVTNGLFAVTLDFGNGVFTGPGRWLQIDVRTNGNSAFVTLLPFQRILAMPYAIMANTASNLLGTLPAAQLSGMAGNFSASNITVMGAIAGNGGGLTNLNPASLGAGTAAVNISGSAAVATTIASSAYPLGFGSPTNIFVINSCPDPNFNLTYYYDGALSTSGAMVWTNMRPDHYLAYLATNDPAWTVGGGFGGGWSLGTNFPDKNQLDEFVIGEASSGITPFPFPGNGQWFNYQNGGFFNFPVLVPNPSVAASNLVAGSVNTASINSANGVNAFNVSTVDNQGTGIPFTMLTDGSPDHHGITFGQYSLLTGRGSIESIAVNIWGAQDPRMTFGMSMPVYGIETFGEGFIQLKNALWTNNPTGYFGFVPYTNQQIRFILGQDSVGAQIEMLPTPYATNGDGADTGNSLGHVVLNRPYREQDMSQLVSSNMLVNSNLTFAGVIGPLTASATNSPPQNTTTPKLWITITYLGVPYRVPLYQ